MMNASDTESDTESVIGSSDVAATINKTDCTTGTMSDCNDSPMDRVIAKHQSWIDTAKREHDDRKKKRKEFHSFMKNMNEVGDDDDYWNYSNQEDDVKDIDYDALGEEDDDDDEDVDDDDDDELHLSVALMLCSSSKEIQDKVLSINLSGRNTKDYIEKKTLCLKILFDGEKHSLDMLTNTLGYGSKRITKRAFQKLRPIGLLHWHDVNTVQLSDSCFRFGKGIVDEDAFGKGIVDEDDKVDVKMKDNGYVDNDLPFLSKDQNDINSKKIIRSMIKKVAGDVKQKSTSKYNILRTGLGNKGRVKGVWIERTNFRKDIIDYIHYDTGISRLQLSKDFDTKKVEYSHPFTHKTELLFQDVMYFLKNEVKEYHEIPRKLSISSLNQASSFGRAVEAISHPNNNGGIGFIEHFHDKEMCDGFLKKVILCLNNEEQKITVDIDIVKQIAYQEGMTDAYGFNVIAELNNFMAGTFEKKYDARTNKMKVNGNRFNNNTKNIFKSTFLHTVGLFERLEHYFVGEGKGKIKGFTHRIKYKSDINKNCLGKRPKIVVKDLKEITNFLEPQCDKNGCVIGVFIFVPGQLLKHLCKGAHTRAATSMIVARDTIDPSTQYSIVQDKCYIVDIINGYVIDTDTTQYTNSRSGKDTSNNSNPLVPYDLSIDEHLKEGISRHHGRLIRTCTLSHCMEGDNHRSLRLPCFKVHIRSTPKSDDHYQNTISHHRLIARIAYQEGINANDSPVVVGHLKTCGYVYDEDNQRELFMDQVFGSDKELRKSYNDYDDEDDDNDEIECCKCNTNPCECKVEDTAKCTDVDHCLCRFDSRGNCIQFCQGTNHRLNICRSYDRKASGEWCYFHKCRVYNNGT